MTMEEGVLSARSSAEPVHVARTPLGEALRRDGYCVVRNVIPPEDVQKLTAILRQQLGRPECSRFGGKYSMRGMNHSPEAAQILCSDHILGLMRDCTAPFPFVLTGECDFTMNTTSNWHKDTTDGMNLGPNLHENRDFGVYKMGIYLQDQPITSRAVFKVKTGAHLRERGHDLPGVALPVKAGDAVIFDLRLDHVGIMPTWSERALHRLLCTLQKPLRLNADRVYTALRAGVAALRPGQRPRFGIFITFGPSNGSVYAYERAARGFHGKITQAFDAAVLAKLKAQGVEILQEGV